jgi:hypothetical protein
MFVPAGIMGQAKAPEPEVPVVPDVPPPTAAADGPAGELDVTRAAPPPRECPRGDEAPADVSPT